MKKVTLVLGSGGARGFAHLGVLKTLNENNIGDGSLLVGEFGFLFFQTGSNFVPFPEQIS